VITEDAMEETKISRRSLLHRTATLATAVVTAGALNGTSAPSARADAPDRPDHDPVTGEIFDRDRHHHWDTV